ncbi:gliding motility-associated C-terminal domain-containing protein [Mucilaginibacter sp. 14171R-50]|uniref:gliding motility-associated C-terminal domain-containing protein n=1 Tax=Mucilaginibacter sp. 14171R-50 TaxID=2703789 RepID=UPI00138BD8A9|nr:gliding motility-associated C-terminal domain-containing protein [Mucilaginibacter sp. 14171R-50]QHS56661.1 gliding motility-associated C-terminal domain-containing protein [Mucilaginibacter sp. 14171R-50]
MNRVKALRVLITFIFVCCSFSGFAQGNTTNQGKEFWTAYMLHIEDNGPSEMALYITGDQNTTGKVEIADGSFQPITFNVTANQVTIVSVPKTSFLATQGKFLKGLHITAEKRVAVYAHIYASSVSGATLLLPVAVLGKDYYSINYKQESNGAEGAAFSTFMIIATEDNTQVEVTLSQTLIDGTPAGTVLSISLNKGEVYQGLSATDLTNTKIRSVGQCKKIAVFSGSSKIGIGCHDNNFTSDNLFQQVYPTASWGKNYITVPLKGRHYDIFRVFLSDPGTMLTVNGEAITAAAIQSNNVYEFSSNEPNTITANKPIQVVQYAVSQGKTTPNSCDFDLRDRGDPEMIYLNPIEQTLDHVTLYSSGYYAINKHYVNVVIKANKASSFKIDGAPYTNFTAILNGGGYAYAQIPVQEGTHYISADDGFNAIAYGFGDHESYGYSAGTNLRNLDEYITFVDPQTNTTQVNGCSGIEYKLQLVLPYQTPQIKWNFNDGSPVQVFNSPIAVPFQRDGKTLYRYDYPGYVKYPRGNYSYTATVVALTDECGSNRDIDFDFSIADYAAADFSYAPSLCSAADVIIHDRSVAEPGSITKVKIWFDFINHPESFEIFNKNEIPADSNYHHRYPPLATDAKYTVKMMVYTGEDGLCDNGAEHEITVKGSPIVSLAAVSPICEGDGPVQLVADNKGFIGDGIYTGTGITSTGLFDPAVSGPGTFTITYTFIRQNGCQATATQDLVVAPLPTVDAGNDLTLLEGESVVLPAKASGSGLTYKWEPAIGLDDANVLNPVCSAIDNQRYKLTVTTDAGCASSDEIVVTVLKKPVIVNAFTPNGDGVNDTWTIKYLETYPGNTVDIYNRQGEKVYSSVGYAIPWDGRYNGSILPTGTYYYIINPKNGRKIISGSVTIIK